MLWFLNAAAGILLVSLTALQSIYVLRYRTILNPQLAGDPHSESDSSKQEAQVEGTAALLMCLRGVDPSLTNCLAGIVSQNHPDFHLHLIFDDHDDPAVGFVHNYFADKDIQPVLHFNTARPKTCSLKCSGLITAVEALPDEIEFVALIDADTVADENWLIDLLSPFTDPKVGATTGNRWFTPHDSELGTVFRKIWNAAAVPQMTLYNIGWGGTLAFRHKTIQEAGFLNAWKTAFCEDTMVSDLLKPLGMTLKRVPSLIMENTESSRLSDAFRWITRQTLTVRLHHRMWPMVLGHAILTAIACYVAPVLMLVGFLTGQHSSATILFACFLIYQLANIGLLMAIDQSNKRVLRQRSGGGSGRVDASSIVTSVCATLLNQLLFPLAVFRAWTTREVDWRGIKYSIGRSGKLEMQDYIPYRLLSTHPETNTIESIN